MFGIAIRYRLEGPGLKPRRGREISLLHTRLNSVWVLPRLMYVNATGGLFPGCREARVYPCLPNPSSARSRLDATITPLLCALMELRKGNILFLPRRTAPRGPRPPHCREFMIVLRHTTVGRTAPDERSARRRDLYLTTYNTHNIQTSRPSGGIRTPNPSKRAATNIHLRPRGHWNLLRESYCAKPPMEKR
jgi:hypothetical protein